MQKQITSQKRRTTIIHFLLLWKKKHKFKKTMGEKQS